MHLKPGTLLHGGTYKIVKVLGQGSFGITYLAEHTALGKNVCIKEFFMKELNSRSEDGSITGLSDGTLSYNYAQKFRKEAMNLACMEHTNIVRVTDSFEENGTCYYVMDYIEGDNLNEYIKDHVLSESEAISIIKDVANALMYMHEQKHMLHLDLKPGNIMRRAGDGHIFLIDFGLSKHYDKNGTPETSTTIGGGTPGYAPTEQGDKAKDGEFRPTIDVYALGATLYKLLTRETPPTASEVVNDDEILTEKLQSIAVSQGTINLIVKSMMPGYKKRTQSIRAFIESLPSTSNATSSINDLLNVETEGNTYINASDTNEETVYADNSAEERPDFEESKYIVMPDYKTFPARTANKGNEGDKEAMLAIGIMALRGEGVKQDFDIAFGWLNKLKNTGDYRGEKLINQWAILKHKYNLSGRGNGKSSRDDNSGLQRTVAILILILMAVLFFIIGLK